MISFALCFVFLCIFACLIMMVCAKEAFTRVLFLGLISAFTVAEIVLWTVYTGETMYLDIALSFALLGFMDVQFYAVYLRRKGDL